MASRQPDILPTLFGAGYGTYAVQRNNFILSFLVHILLAMVTILLAIYINTQAPAIKQQVTGLVIDVGEYILPPSTSKAGGGGGGGDLDKINAPKGALPKQAKDQFTPPEVVVRNPDPKLQIAPTVVAPNIQIAQSNLGDPLSKLIAQSNGTGMNSGIGSGGYGGVGTGTGPGVGPGEYGGVGGGPYQVGNGVSAPRAIYQPDPDYSEEARKAKYQGTVVVSFVVGADGRTRDIRVIRSLGLGLDEKAVEAVKTWRFDPARKGNQPVAVIVNAEVSFHLY